MDRCELFLELLGSINSIHQVTVGEPVTVWTRNFTRMNLKYSVCIVIILYSNESLVYCDKVYSINDQVLSCSGWLSTIIFNFCNNTYKIVKRDTSPMIDKMAPKDLQKETNRQRIVDDHQWRRVRRQVASECCLRPCTVADIIMYCPNDAKLLQENPDIFD